ncbi:MAG: hypothetical protein ABW007_13215 [Chitinophagaceae bacterium]
MKKITAQKRIWIAAEWLSDNDTQWWFFANMQKANQGDKQISLVGNAKWYNENDRKSLPGHMLYVFKTFCFAVRLTWVAKRNDIIFCWNQLPALIAATLLRLTFSKKKIVCQNFLFRNSGNRFADALRRSLYNFALKYKHLYLSLQNESLFDYYKDNCRLALKREKTYFIGDCLPDDRVPPTAASAVIPEHKQYIFTGGEANRNWKLVMTIAQRLPEFQFYCVARKRFFDQQLNIPANVTMFWDTSLEQYFQLLLQCKVSFIPIKDPYNPAGLLLLFDSVLSGKAVLSSDTPFLSPYFGKYQERLVFSSAEDAVTKIKELYHAEDIAEVNAHLRKNIENQTPSAYCAQQLEKLYQLSEIN